MKDLLLALDIGNTTIEFGVFRKDALLGSWRLSSTVSRTPDESWLAVAGLLRDANLDPKQLAALALASVVPEHTGSLTAMAQARFDTNPLVISTETCPFIEVRYHDPRQVGADRLCNAYAGAHYYGAPVVVVDFGTAITLDVVDQNGAYLGGVIAPGPGTSAAQLHRRTAQLPKVTLDFPDRIIGDSTEHAIRAGITWGIVDMVDGLIDRICAELGSNPKVVATGGWSPAYSQRSRRFTEHDPNLTLQGVRLLHERVRGAA